MNEMYLQQDLLHIETPPTESHPQGSSVLSKLNTAQAYAGHTARVEPMRDTRETNSSDGKAVEANVTEIIIAKNKADNVQLLLPMLTHLHKENRWLAWIDPPMELLKKWSVDSGTDGRDIMVLRSNTDISATSLAEKALAAGTCHAVILWTEGLGPESFEKLERASVKGDSHGIVLRNR